MSLHARPPPAFRLRHSRKRLSDLLEHTVNDRFSGRSPPHGLGHGDPDRRTVGATQLALVPLEGDAHFVALRKYPGERRQVPALRLLYGRESDQAKARLVRPE